MENVPLLFWSKQRIVQNGIDACRECVRPDHFIGAKHDAFFEAGINQSLKEAVELFSRERVTDDTYVDIELWVRIKSSNRIVGEWPPGMHRPDAQFRMPNQYVFQ